MSQCEKCNHSCGKKNNEMSYLVKFYFDIKGNRGDGYKKRIKSRLMERSGIKEIKLNDNSLEVLYDDILINEEDIEKLLELQMQEILN